MIRFVSRTLGFLFVAAAFAALVVDGTRSIAGGRALFYALGDFVAWLAGARFEAATSLLAHMPAPVDGLGAVLLAAPGCLVSGLLGLVLLVLGRAPSPAVGRSLRGG